MVIYRRARPLLFFVLLVLLCSPLISSRRFPRSLTMPVSRLSAGSVGDRVIFAGGAKYGNPQTIYSDSTFVVDLSEPHKEFSSPPLVDERYDMATSIVGNKVFFMGGNNYSGATNAVDIYNLLTLERTTLTMASRRSFPNFGVNGGPDWTEAILAGGRHGHGMAVDPKIIETISDPTYIVSANVSLTHLAAPQTSISFKSNGHRLTAFMGQTFPSVDTIELYNHSTHLISDVTLKSSVPRRNMAAAVSEDGKYFLVIGGMTEGVGPLSSVDIFSTENLTLVKTVSMQFPRAFTAAASLGPYVYIAGGFSDAESTIYPTTVEVIDLRDWTVFTAPDKLSLGVSELVGVSVQGTAVLFAGGRGNERLGHPSSPYIDIFTCGNGVIDTPFEACDQDDSNCSKDCLCLLPCLTPIDLSAIPPTIFSPSPTSPPTNSPSMFIDSPSSLSISRAPSSQPKNLTLIISIVIAVVVLLIVITGGVLYMVIRRKRTQAEKTVGNEAHPSLAKQAGDFEELSESHQ